jgi:uncharacterized membrane protein YeiB
VGLPLTLFGVYGNFKAGWQAMEVYFRGEFLDYLGSLFVAFGWVGVVMLACKSAGLQAAVPALKAVGRAAFSNYILQTLICTTVFYGRSRLSQLFPRATIFGAENIPLSITRRTKRSKLFSLPSLAISPSVVMNSSIGNSGLLIA